MKSTEKQKIWKNKNYQINKDYFLRRQRERRQKRREIVLMAKEGKCCTDCKNVFPPCVMDFDHRKNKKFNVSSLSMFSSDEDLLTEIAKCDLVCANCHRLRHNS